MQRHQGLQDLFLNQVRRENIGVTIYLSNSVQLRGNVRGFDQFTILLDSPGRPTHLVYKSSVTSIVPGRQVSMKEAAERGFDITDTPESEGQDA